MFYILWPVELACCWAGRGSGAWELQDRNLVKLGATGSLVAFWTAGEHSEEESRAALVNFALAKKVCYFGPSEA